MNTDVLMLPNDFGSGKTGLPVIYYSARNSSVKNKVIFTQSLICILVAGAKDVYTGALTQRINNNQLLMLTSGSTLMSETMAENGRYEAILLFIENKTLLEYCLKHNISVGKVTEPNGIYTVEKDEFLYNYEKSLLLLKNNNNPDLRIIKTEELLTYLHAREPETLNKYLQQALGDKVALNLQQVVQNPQNKGLTLNELAFLCNMSISTFKRRFAEVYGSSPQKYLTEKKMQSARNLLLLRRRPSEIYSELGYHNLSAFSNEFKKHFGVPPSRYKHENELKLQTFEPSA